MTVAKSDWAHQMVVVREVYSGCLGGNKVKGHKGGKQKGHSAVEETRWMDTGDISLLQVEKVESILNIGTTGLCTVAEGGKSIRRVIVKLCGKVMEKQK